MMQLVLVGVTVVHDFEVMIHIKLHHSIGSLFYFFQMCDHIYIIAFSLLLGELICSDLYHSWYDLHIKHQVVHKLVKNL